MDRYFWGERGYGYRLVRISGGCLYECVCIYFCVGATLSRMLNFAVYRFESLSDTFTDLGIRNGVSSSQRVYRKNLANLTH